jgi:hypothetical protein
MSNFDPTMVARVRAERAQAEFDDDVDTLADGTQVLKDGCSLRVPLFMADGSINPALTFEQRLVAQKAQQALRDKAITEKEAKQMPKQTFSDEDARKFRLQDGRQLHRPGFRFTADPYAKDEAILAHADYDAELQDAYKGKKARDPDEEGDEDLVEDLRASGYSKEIADKTSASTRGVDGLSARDAARIEYEDDLCNAWRNPVGIVPASDSAVPAPQRPDLTKDAATVARDHQESMSRLYAQLDSELSEKWRGNQ